MAREKDIDLELRTWKSIREARKFLESAARERKVPRVLRKRAFRILYAFPLLENILSVASRVRRRPTLDETAARVWDEFVAAPVGLPRKKTLIAAVRKILEEERLFYSGVLAVKGKAFVANPTRFVDSDIY